MNIAAWLTSTARLTPVAPALLRGAMIEADYTTFARRAGSIGAYLADFCGVTPGDRVGLFMANCTQYLECLYGIWWAGAVAVPINAKLHEREAAIILDDAGAKLTFVRAGAALGTTCPVLSVDDDLYHTIVGVAGGPTPAPREAADLAWLFYTSGTTGRSKGVKLSHGNLVAMSLCYLADVDSVGSGDAALYAAPMSHGAGLYNFIHVRMGARHVVPLSEGFDPAEVLTLANELRNVSMFAAPTMVRRLTEVAKERGLTGEGLRTIVYGGGPMYLADIKDALATFGPKFVQIYGQGESPMTITALQRRWHAQSADPRWAERLGSVGTAQSVVVGPLEGCDHFRRYKHLSARSRRGASRARDRQGSMRDRRARSRMG